jgi:TRAP-type uncharacterized transport system fused permease subunit
VPLIFAYQPFLSSDPTVQLAIAAFALPGIYALSAAIEGFAEARLSVVERAVLGVAGFVLIVPFGQLVNWIALAVFVALMALNLVKARRAARLAATPAA